MPQIPTSLIGAGGLGIIRNRDRIQALEHSRIIRLSHIQPEARTELSCGSAVFTGSYCGGTVDGCLGAGCLIGEGTSALAVTLLKSRLASKSLSADALAFDFRLLPAPAVRPMNRWYPIQPHLLLAPAPSASGQLQELPPLSSTYPYVSSDCGFGFVFSYGLKIEVMVILGAPSPSARSRLRGSIWIRSGATLAPDSERDAGNGEHNHGTTRPSHGGTRGRQTGVRPRTSVTVIAACTIAGPSPERAYRARSWHSRSPRTTW